MEFILPKKNKEAVLSQETAQQMLSNVFEACEYQENTIPLEVLQSYSHYRRERHLLQRIVILLVAFLFLLAPVLFITANVDVAWVPGTPAGSPIIQVITKSPVPIERVTAAIGDYILDVYQVSDGVYQIRPNRNGTLTVTVTLINKQFTQTQLEVSNVDVTPPKLLSSEHVGDDLIIRFTDDSGTLDFKNIYAVNNAGKVIYPKSYDTRNLSVTFAYPKENLNIFVPDKCKNTLQLVLTVQ